MMLERAIRMIGSGREETAKVTCTPRDGLCHLVLNYRDTVLEETATDYFEAFCRVRLKLESEGWLPFCYAASLNVYPSGMARQMGAGLKAYRMTMGKHAQRPDLVDIFDEGPDVVPATVSQQKEYVDAWYRSGKA